MVGPHALSIDVEHWYDATLATRPAAAQPEFARREIEAVLELLAAHGAKATFFVLGHLAQELPASVRAIADAGHEIGCHGMTHDLLWQMGEQRFRHEVAAAKAVLEDLTGHAVRGYRAATWSLDARSPWAPAALLDLGFTYDSSVFPLRTPLYGVAGAPLKPYRLRAGAGALLELPPAVGSLLGLRVPFAGGMYWRLLPTGLVLGGLRGEGTRVLYAHPWEVAPGGWSLPASSGVVARFSMGFGRRHLRQVLLGLLRQVTFLPLGLVAAKLPDDQLEDWTFVDGSLVRSGH